MAGMLVASPGRIARLPSIAYQAPRIKIGIGQGGGGQP
jgi:hypothetical protein